MWGPDLSRRTEPPILDPIYDPQRLAAVLSSGLLDGAREESFDALTRLAAIATGAPLAFATVVDETRSFWKSTFGVAPEGPRENTVEESFCQYVVRSRSEVVVGDASLDPLTRDNPSIASMGVRAWAGFPMRAAGGEVLGSFCVVDTVPRAWTQRDLDVLRTLAEAATNELRLRAAIVAERAARARAEALATTLRDSLLPPALLAVPGLDVQACFHPAGRGVDLVGDFYDLYHARDDRWSFVIGDVCGKGLPAAKVATLARYTVGAATMRRASPAAVLAGLNETMLARAPEAGLFLTAIYGEIRRDGDAFVVRMACGGHVPPVLRRAGGETAFVAIGGPLIGVLPDYHVDEVALRLEPGDAVVFYTDGVTEARDGGELFGDERLCRLVAKTDPRAGSAHIAVTVADAARAYCAGDPSDDVAVFVLRVPHPDDAPVATGAVTPATLS